MGYYCTVPQCTSLAGKTKNVKFHRFPRDVTMADKWNIILKRGKPYTKYSKVCSLHFTQSDYNVTTMGQWKTLSKDAVPSQNLPKLHPDGSVMVIRKSRTVKYRESRKDSNGEKCEKWSVMSHQPLHAPNAANIPEQTPAESHDPNIAYRLQTLSAIASALPPQLPTQKPKKQDAIMQTDPVQSEEDCDQPNNSYSETSDNSFNDQIDYTMPKEDPLKDYQQKDYQQKDYSQRDYHVDDKKYESPKDYTKHEDYMPQTNEEYNKEAEKYALERKSHNGYEKSVIDYQKSTTYQKEYQKVVENAYQKLPEVYNTFEKDYPRNDYMGYQYPDTVEILRNQQHNLEMLQQQHRITENQNFFNENHIKQEIDMNSEEEKFMYERAKDQIDATAMYGGRDAAQQQRLLEHLQQQVKQEPDAAVCDSVMQPQGSPYYAANGHTDGSGGYYGALPRPGPELLIAKQNALAAHTQLWQNTMKRPFFYSETPHYSALHRYEDLTRILQ